MRKPKIDPVLSALIAKLPASGAAWSVEQRTAWFEMMWLACASVYGGPAVDAPMFTKRGAYTETHTLPEGPHSLEVSRPAGAKPVPPFFIDEKGYARRGVDAERINPQDVSGNVIVDLRGEAGDLGAIQWADGSTGVRGHQLEITTSVS